MTYVDSFGNVRLAGDRDDLSAAFGALGDGAPLSVEFGAADGTGEVLEQTRFGATFGTVAIGASVLYVDSLGNLAMADYQGNLAGRLGIGPDRPVRVRAT